MDINTVNNQANIIANQAVELQRSVSYLSQYKNTLSQNWYGPEKDKIIIAIDNEISKLRRTLTEMNSISNDMKKAAQAIQQEENERIAREKAAKAAKVNEAKADLEVKQKEYDSLIAQKQELEKKIALLKSGGLKNSKELLSIVNQLNDLLKKIATSQKLRDQSMAILSNLRM